MPAMLHLNEAHIEKNLQWPSWENMSDMIEPDEQRIIDRARKGDRASFDFLVERYGPRINSMIVHRVGNREDAEDFTQETFIRIYRALPNISGRFSDLHLDVQHRNKCRRRNA